MAISAPLDANRKNVTLGTSSADGATVVLPWTDPTTHRQLVDALVSSATVSGSKSNNAGVPGATNLGVLPAISNATAPTYIEGNQVLLSTDLSGNLRTTATIAANSSINVNQIGGAAVLVGNGVTGTGSQRVTIASDQTAFSVNAIQSGNWTSRIVGNAGGILDAAGQNAASPANALLISGQFNTTPTTIVSGNVSPLQLDASGNMKVNVVAGSAGNAAASATGAAVPANASYDGINVAGTLRGQTGVNPSGTIYATQIDVASIAGTTASVNNGVVDAGTLRVTLASNSTGTVIVTQATAANLNAQVQGAAASGATKSGNPVQVGGVFNTTQPTVLTGQVVELQATARGAQIVSTGADTFNVTVNAALPAGANIIGALSANQSVNTAQINGVAPSMGSGVNGTGVQRVTLATDQSAVTTAGLFSVKVDQTTPGTTNAVSIAQIGATTVLNGGVAGSLSVGGTVATNVAINANPVNLGAQAISAENAVVTATRQVQLVGDLTGKLITLPYANPENFISGVTAAIIDTTNTTVIAAQAAGVRNYITHIIVTNSHATVSTVVEIRDGAVTVLYRGFAVANGGGFSVTLPVPLRGTAATALTASCITTGSNVYVSASGYKGV